jgi:hypothetical protein
MKLRRIFILRGSMKFCRQKKNQKVQFDFLRLCFHTADLAELAPLIQIVGLINSYFREGT